MSTPTYATPSTINAKDLSEKSVFTLSGGTQKTLKGVSKVSIPFDYQSPKPISIDSLSSKRKLQYTPLVSSKTTKMPDYREENPTVSKRSCLFETPIKSSLTDSHQSSDDSDECEFSINQICVGNTTVITPKNPKPRVGNAKNERNNQMISMEEPSLSITFQLHGLVSSLAYSSKGNFIIAGFNNGMIRIYPMDQERMSVFHSGILLEQIEARGMYTSLMVHVEISKDEKYLFAGVYRGSTDMIAFDLSTLELPSIDSALLGEVQHACVKSYTHSDAKLKGFGALYQVPSNSSNTEHVYHLLCGRGIKNIHLWKFSHSRAKNLNMTSSPTWECIMDRATNSMTVELTGFDHHCPIALSSNCSSTVFSKSLGQNIRVWQQALDQDEEESGSDGERTISYEDIRNTQDAIALVGNFAYCSSSTDTIGVVDLLNNIRVELPIPTTTANIGIEQKERKLRSVSSSRRRKMRSIVQISGCTSHQQFQEKQRIKTFPQAIILCSDGSIWMHTPSKTLGIHTPLIPLHQISESDASNCIIGIIETKNSELLLCVTNGSKDLKTHRVQALLDNNGDLKHLLNSSISSTPISTPTCLPSIVKTRKPRKRLLSSTKRKPIANIGDTESSASECEPDSEDIQYDKSGDTLEMCEEKDVRRKFRKLVNDLPPLDQEILSEFVVASQSPKPSFQVEQDSPPQSIVTESICKEDEVEVSSSIDKTTIEKSNETMGIPVETEQFIILNETKFGGNKEKEDNLELKKKKKLKKKLKKLKHKQKQKIKEREREKTQKKLEKIMDFQSSNTSQDLLGTQSTISTIEEDPDPNFSTQSTIDSPLPSIPKFYYPRSPLLKDKTDMKSLCHQHSYERQKLQQRFERQNLRMRRNLVDECERQDALHQIIRKDDAVKYDSGCNILWKKRRFHLKHKQGQEIAPQQMPSQEPYSTCFPQLLTMKKVESRYRKATKEARVIQKMEADALMATQALDWILRQNNEEKHNFPTCTSNCNEINHKEGMAVIQVPRNR